MKKSWKTCLLCVVPLMLNGSENQCKKREALLQKSVTIVVIAAEKNELAKSNPMVIPARKKMYDTSTPCTLSPSTGQSASSSSADDQSVSPTKHMKKRLSVPLERQPKSPTQAISIGDFLWGDGISCSPSPSDYYRR